VVGLDPRFLVCKLAFIGISGVFRPIFTLQCLADEVYVPTGTTMKLAHWQNNNFVILHQIN
jgi:hypothetical protein